MCLRKKCTVIADRLRYLTYANQAVRKRLDQHTFEYLRATCQRESAKTNLLCMIVPVSWLRDEVMVWRQLASLQDYYRRTYANT